MSETLQLELAGLKRDWIEDVAPRVAVLAPGLGEFTADDLHAKLPPPQEFNWWGVLLAKLKRLGVIADVGARPSRRPCANGRKITVWSATGRGLA